MDFTVLVPGIVGAICGALGWLCVGLYMSRRQAHRQAINAGRAVYFELSMNRMGVRVAREYDAFTDLSRSAFDRLLPELATWLDPGELQTVVAAYAGHVGYAQLAGDSAVPPELRRQALTGILDAHDRAIELLRSRVFSERDALAMEKAERAAEGSPPEPADAQPGSRSAR